MNLASGAGRGFFTEGDGAVMDGNKKRAKRSVNLRRNRRTTIFNPEKVTTVWDDERREWKIIVESANATIEHSRLTDEKRTA